jgi:hypothetical protein
LELKSAIETAARTASCVLGACYFGLLAASFADCNSTLDGTITATESALVYANDDRLEPWQDPDPSRRTLALDATEDRSPVSEMNGWFA